MKRTIVSSPRAANDRSLGVKCILIKTDAPAWRELRHLAIARGTTLQQLGIEALNMLLKKHNRPQIVRNPYGPKVIEK